MNLASRGRLPSLASDTASDAIEHGFAPLDRVDGGRGTANSAVVNCESFSNGLKGNATIQIVAGTWDYTRTKDSFFGPTWRGRSGSGTDLEQKKQDMRDTFENTPRRYVMMYSISAQKSGSTSYDEGYYDPVINGDDDQEYIDMATELVSMGMGDTIIRPNPEHSRDWSRRYPTDSNGNTISDPDVAGQKYGDAFAHVVNLMMGVSGADFTWLYSPAGRFFGADIGNDEGPENDICKEGWPVNSSNWPSGEDPPIVCPTFYDSTDNGGPTASEWDSMTDAEKKSAAIDQWVDTDKSNIEPYNEWATNDVNAPNALVEWGTKTWKPDGTIGDGSARGDNPWYIDLVINYLRSNDWNFQHVWSYSHNEGTNSILWDDGSVPDGLDESFDAVRYQMTNGHGKYIETNP